MKKILLLVSIMLVSFNLFSQTYQMETENLQKRIKSGNVTREEYKEMVKKWGY